MTHLALNSVTHRSRNSVTHRAKDIVTLRSQAGHNKLILSIFPGVDLLGMAFEEFGFCVVRGPDLIYGGDIRSFNPPAYVFWGIIGGSPCQDFSPKRRADPTGYGLEMLGEFARVVGEASPEWFLLENVARVPDVTWPGCYVTQRFEVNQSWFEPISRLRHIQFGSLGGQLLNVTGSAGSVTEGAALANDDRSFSELVRIQGLPPDFDIPGFTVTGKKKAVGNGVPLSIGRALARAVADAFEPGSVTEDFPRGGHNWGRRCACGCGRPVTGRAAYHGPACRKRAQRKRDRAEQPSHE